eukprot:TRINITY_DN13288_c0_g3_i1.p1 TRINITY_DN13288_c0_g3~~TRINITY_DN13288_c0_g3_i1.p1  ORF type:complete len:606 (-),score=108.43 TRINITY_DN13288_c0_g3_i1:180-1997(-)
MDGRMCCRPRPEQKVVLLGTSSDLSSPPQPQEQQPQTQPRAVLPSPQQQRSAWRNDTLAPELVGLDASALDTVGQPNEEALRLLLQEHQERLQNTLAEHDRLQEARFQQLRDLMNTKSGFEQQRMSWAGPARAPQAVNSPRQSGASARIAFDDNSDDLPARRLQGALPNSEDIKLRIRHSLKEERFVVTDAYHTEGICQRIARSKLFENLTLGVIAANALWIAYDADYNDSPTLFKGAGAGFVIVEMLFCIYFFSEWLVRLLSFKDKRDGWKDFWFKFDTVLVGFMLFETILINFFLAVVDTSSGRSPFKNASLLRLFRLLRLTRMARMSRLLRSCPEIMVLVKGMFVATRTVISSLALLVMIVYFFAIACTMMSKDTSAGTLFPSTLSSMYVLVVDGILPDNASILNTGAEASWMLAIVLFLFLLLSCVTVMNLLVGVLVEAIQCVGQVEKEQVLADYLRETLSAMLKKTDMNGDQGISIDEFNDLLKMPEATRAIKDVGVDVVALVDFVDHLFQNQDVIQFSDFMQLLLQLRGTNTCTVKDILDLRKALTFEITMLRSEFLLGAPEPAEPSLQEQPSEVDNVDNVPPSVDAENIQAYAAKLQS